MSIQHNPKVPIGIIAMISREGGPIREQPRESPS